MSGKLSYDSSGWVLGPLSGEVLGGAITGGFKGKTTPGSVANQRVRFDVELSDVKLKSAAALIPGLGNGFDGMGTLRIAGDFDRGLDATAELNVPKARLTSANLAIQSLHASATLGYSPSAHAGSLQVTRLSAKVAGGQIVGKSLFRLGEAERFQSSFQLSQLDLDALTHAYTDGGKPARGKISGQVQLEGPSLARFDKMRGKITLDLDDGSLFSLPVLSSIARFLGVARSGVFEDGDLYATIANNRLSIDELTLSGRMMQLHSRGTIEFDGRLNLQVVLTSNELLALPSQVLRAIVPIGRGGVSGALSNQLIKLRITGTIGSPSVQPDPTIDVDDSMTRFFLMNAGAR